MELSLSGFCKLNELKKSTSLEPEVPKCNKDKDKVNWMFDEKEKTHDDNNNSIDGLKPHCKKTKKFVPNIIAKKYSNSKNEVTIYGDTKYSMECQRPLKTEDASFTIERVEFTRETKTSNNNDLFLRDVSNDTSAVKTAKKEKSAWQTLNFFLRDTYRLDAPKLTNKFRVEDEPHAYHQHHLEKVKATADSSDINCDPRIKIEEDVNHQNDKHEEKEELDVFQFNWNILCDEYNNNLDELVEREDTEKVTEKFQNFLVQNYFSVGKSIPEIVKLDIDDTRTLDFNFHVCPMCEEKSENSLDFSNHLISCGNQPFFVCLYCTHRTQSTDVLRKHIITRHLHRLQKKLIKCPRCHKGFANRDSLRRHLAYCGKERNFRCNVCSYRTNIKHNLSAHISRRHLHEAQECLQCNKTFKSSSCLNEHLKYFENKSAVQSNKYFKNTSEYRLKTCSDIHNNDGKFTKYCPRCFHFLGSSKKMNCCLCESRVLYQCRKCDTSFDKYSTIFLHDSKCNPQVNFNM